MITPWQLPHNYNLLTPTLRHLTLLSTSLLRGKIDRNWMLWTTNVTHQDGKAEGLDLRDEERKRRVMFQTPFFTEKLKRCEVEKEGEWLECHVSPHRSALMDSLFPRKLLLLFPWKHTNRKFLPPQASPPLQQSVVRRQRDQLFWEHQHHLYFSASVLRLSTHVTQNI